MKKSIIAIILLLSLLGIFLLARNYLSSESCDLEKDAVCYVEETEQFEFEEEASVLVRVENTTIQEELLKLWESTYSNAVLKIEIADVVDAQSVDNVDEDIFLMTHQQAAFVVDKLYPLKRELMDYANEKVNLSLVSDINFAHGVMIPAFLEGSPMIIDTELLENDGFSLDVVSSFENIFNHFDELSQAYEVVFPFVFDDFDLVYPFLTHGGWTPFDTYQQEDAHFESDEFLEGLDFIAQLGKYQWDKKNSENKAEDFSYQFDTVLINEKGPLSQYVGYVNLPLIAQTTDKTYQFSSLPSVGEQSMTHLVEVSGWVINAKTEYPSASHEVMKFLRSDEAMAILVDQTHVPAIKSNALDIDESLKKMSEALRVSKTKPMVIRVDNPDKLIWDVFEDINITESIQAVYNQEMTSIRAQEKILMDYEEWLESGGD